MTVLPLVAVARAVALDRWLQAIPLIVVAMALTVVIMAAINIICLCKTFCNRKFSYLCTT